MGIWITDPDETFLARGPVTFATGAAPRVKGMRWFRDTERNDIQGELPGWPEGPVYTQHSTGGSLARRAGKGAVLGLGVAVMAVLSAAGGNLSGDYGPDSGSDTPDDPADEVEDFPVMWAAPGTLARTLPWQLDPGRSDEKRYRTQAIVTDRRLVVVGFPFSKKEQSKIEDEVLWETPRSTIASVDRRNFRIGTDLRILFTDGSWCRLRSVSRRKLIWPLTEPRGYVSLESLTDDQRATVEAFIADRGPEDEAPLITQNPCGCYQVRAVDQLEVNADFGVLERNMVMDANGVEVEPVAYHPEDFPS
ncbi:hypothetical protein [Streptomyces formicae]|uniref:Putative integral membrane protein n=1 Tax=Streptomyces formicae TaxID=1616117 RepID=A0A291QBL3_9ACTN|nr:hypothetical protein [Streptomyces formicae]ATL28845.1 putative integral membrane protein [Streptomyces formicae]